VGVAKRFTGVYYRWSVEPLVAPAGTYTVNASFAWFVPGLDRRERAQQTFEWPPVTASRPLDG
jgi:hypothetical protein